MKKNLFLDYLLKNGIDPWIADNMEVIIFHRFENWDAMLERKIVSIIHCILTYCKDSENLIYSFMLHPLKRSPHPRDIMVEVDFLFSAVSQQIHLSLIGVNVLSLALNGYLYSKE